MVNLLEEVSYQEVRPKMAKCSPILPDFLTIDSVLEMNFSPQEYDTYKLEDGDILLNEGQSIELVGRPAMYRGEVPGACFQNTLVRFRPSSGLLPEFALAVFRGYLHNHRFRRIARWTVNIAHLGAERFAAVEFPLPPYNEQKRIVLEIDHRLSFIESLETSTTANLKRADRLRQAILRRVFEGNLVPHDPDQQPASVPLDRITRGSRTQSTFSFDSHSDNDGGVRPHGSPPGTSRN
jgi:type I restriction enzyme S subunit